MPTTSAVRLVIKHPVPSLNRLFAMNPWQRRKEKQATQEAFLLALQSLATDEDSLTLTIYARNFLSTVLGTPGSSATIVPKKSHSQFGKSKYGPELASALKSLLKE